MRRAVGSVYIDTTTMRKRTVVGYQGGSYLVSNDRGSVVTEFSSTVERFPVVDPVGSPLAEEG